MYLCSIMILSFLFFAFVFYLLFKLVFDFIIPVYKTTRKLKKGFREMREKMQGQSNNGANSYQQKTSANRNKKEPSGDYIDFEEVKE